MSPRLGDYRLYKSYIQNRWTAMSYGNFEMFRYFRDSMETHIFAFDVGGPWDIWASFKDKINET